MKARSSGSTDDGDEIPVDADLPSRPPPKSPSPSTLNTRPDAPRSRRSSANANWNAASNPHGRNGSAARHHLNYSATTALNGEKHVGVDTGRGHSRDMASSEKSPNHITPAAAASSSPSPPSAAAAVSSPVSASPSSPVLRRRASPANPWALTLLIFVVSSVGLSLLVAILQSLVTRQLDPKGCRMSYMRPSYVHHREFDTEHTRFASKYSLYLYREQGIDDDKKLNGIPVLFIPGNAGSYKQVRPIAAEAANYFNNVLKNGPDTLANGIRTLDFFTVDFNEDITAFHGQTLLDQAEYLNEAIRYILSLYMDPRLSSRPSHIPDPSSVIILGHSMGGVVARTMLVMPNYQSNSINTIITLSAPHSRPPVTFDGEIVQIYNDINDYWRRAYSQKWANDNPLWHVTLVSIAGGGLDTVVPSDYANLESLVPETHGVTVYTTTIPTVWTSMDHQAILWCDQFRKVVARAMYDVVDVNRPSQTKPRAERMRVFKKWFLTGLEPSAERSLPDRPPTTLLTLDDHSSTVIASGHRLTLRSLGGRARPKTYLLPVPPHGSPHSTRFTLLTDSALGGPLDVFLCSVFSHQPGQASSLLLMDMDISGDGTGQTRLACKSASPDLIILPASTATSSFPFSHDSDQLPTFSYLQYDVEDIADHQFVAVVDKAKTFTNSFVLAEFADRNRSHLTKAVDLPRLAMHGLHAQLPADRPTVVEMTIPSIRSSLLAYHLDVSRPECGKTELFAPLVRQHLNHPYESKYFVNARHADVSLHGVAPFVPPPLHVNGLDDSLSFQFWTDPTCDSELQIDLRVDVLGSLGKLYMRYRTVFASFPLLIVAMVLRKQFQIYDKTGSFVSFTEGLDLCLRRSLPLLMLSLTLLSVSSNGAISSPPGPKAPTTSPATSLPWDTQNTTHGIDFTQNDRLTGLGDPFFWFLVPLIGVVCLGVCVTMHYMTLVLTWSIGVVYGLALGVLKSPVNASLERRRLQSVAFVPSSPQRRMITAAVLLFLVSTFIPYQFAYLVACLVQLFTATRALRIVGEVPSMTNGNFYAYSHSILLLMLWVLPINLPILAVWIRNLAVHWLTPFSSHHNVLSIMSFILLVENLTTGKMIPRVTSWPRHITGALFVVTALYAAVYGITYAFMLHHLVHVITTWLVLIHFTSGSWSLAGLRSMFEGQLPESRKRGKTP